MAEIHLRLELSPALARWGLAGLFMVFYAHDLGSETVTMTTYYPAPSGVYNRMITTDSTWLARDGGNVGIGTGATNPTAKLHLAGSLRIADGSEGAGKILMSSSDGTASWSSVSKGVLSCTTVDYQAVDSPNATVVCPTAPVGEPAWQLVGGGCAAGSPWYGSGTSSQGLATSVPYKAGMGGTVPNSWNCHQTNNLGVRDAHAYAVCCRIL